MSSETKTILLVEDEALISLNEAMLLTRAGYTVITVSTGEKAIEQAGTAGHIDLILMDINLGAGIDGTEAAEVILERHDLPILFLSSHTESAVVEKTERITNYGYVTKNAGFTVLDASIKMALKLFEAKSQIADAYLELQSVNNALSISEEKFSKAFEANPDAVMIGVFSTASYMDVNAGFEKMLGYAKQEVVGRSALPGDLGIWAHKEDRDRYAREMSSKGQIDDFEAEFRKKGGEQLTGLLSARLLEINGEQCVLAIAKDITSHKAMADREARFKTAFENAPIGISLTEFDGRLTNVNQAYCDMLGYTMKEINQTTFMDLTHPDDVALSLDHTRKLHDGVYETTRFQKRYIHKDGHIVWVDISMSLMRDAKGNPRNFIAHTQDITREKNSRGLTL